MLDLAHLGHEVGVVDRTAMEEHAPPNDAAVRRLLLENLDGFSLGADQVASVVVEGSWLCVVLAVVPATPELAAAAHRALATAYPQAQVEVRIDQLIFRGGAGFGEGRYVVAVLGGKGGVGKSTIAVNLALTVGNGPEGRSARCGHQRAGRSTPATPSGE
jgi:hypothetical protein